MFTYKAQRLSCNTCGIFFKKEKVNAVYCVCIWVTSVSTEETNLETICLDALTGKSIL